MSGNSSYRLLFRFILLSLGVFTLSRVFLVVYYWDRVGVSSIVPLFVGGLRIDLCFVAMASILPAVLITIFGSSKKLRRYEANYYRLFLIVFVLLELITPTFISQYDSRPNRLFFEYMQHPKEVTSMLMKGFGGIVVLFFTVLVFSIVFSRKLFPIANVSSSSPSQKLARLLACGVLGFVPIRGTLAHRPINPSTVSFSSDRMVNTLPLNSPYSLVYALYRMKDEKNAGAFYGKMPEEQMHKVVRESSGIVGEPLDANRPSLHFQQASVSHDAPPNVVIILEESLGARYVGHLTGAPYTPELDALSKEGWTLKNLYATGTRSARGIEAVITGFLPTPARSVLKLGMAQSNFFTLANIFNSNGYDSTFMYGGESHFDNMKGFLLNNGFERVIDLPKFEAPVFVGSWGVSDEDMFNRLDDELNAAKKPQFIFAFSVSNHTPYEYPEGRIEPDPPKAATVGNTIRYADWAIGDFFRKAKTREYYDNTIFLIVADHDSRVYGASLIPIEHFHIPGMFLGRGVKHKDDNRLVSQIDLAPTLLSLAGISGVHPMLGFDLTKQTDNWEGRALMQYGDNFGYREGNRLVVLQPNLPPTQYIVSEKEKLNQGEVDPSIKATALAHALWPSWAYRNRRYSPYFHGYEND